MPFALLLMSVLERAFFHFEVGLKKTEAGGGEKKGSWMNSFFIYYVRGRGAPGTERTV